VITSLVGALILVGIVYDIARLITTVEPRRPPLAGLRGRRGRRASRGLGSGAWGGPPPSPPP
jgi:hypothetical protein